MNNNTTDNFWNDDLVKEYTHDVIIKALNERTVSPRTWDEQILKFKQSKQSKKQGMGKPTYKLLKDLPYAKAGDPIFYSKKGDLYFCISNVNERKYFRKEIVENSKDWFQLQQPKEEQPKRFEIQGFCRSKGAISNVSGKPYNIYEFTSFELIPEDKYEAIKLAIERELDGVGSGLVQDLGLEFNLDAYKPFLKKEKLDAMMENVWNAAREFTGGTAQNTFYDIASQLKYKTFQDYQQSLPENKPETQTTSNASIECQNEERPVLGLIPLWLWKQTRLENIEDAIDRYKEAGKQVPQAWLDEKYLLTIK